MGFMTEKTYALCLLSLATVFLYADQNLLAPNLSAIAKDFGFTEREKDWKLGGELSFGFFLLGAPVTLIVGYLADTANRCILFGVIIFLGESACMLTYWSSSFSQLFILRTLTGISVGGANPIIFSLIGDYFPGRSRIHVSTLICGSMGIGISAGQMFSGFMGPIYGWRLPFLVVPIPALIAALLLVLTVKDPKRGSQEDYILSLQEDTETINSVTATQSSSSSISIQKHSSSEFNHRQSNDEQNIPEFSEKINKQKLYNLICTPSVILSLIQGMPGCIPWGVITVFLNDYLATERGFSVAGATSIFMFFGFGGMFGQLFGGWGGQRLYNYDKRLQCLFMGLACVVGCTPILVIINGPLPALDHLHYYYIMSMLGGFALNITGPNVRSVLQVRKLGNMLSHMYIIFMYIFGSS